MEKRRKFDEEFRDGADRMILETGKPIATAPENWTPHGA
jgi:transposase-like protein